MSLLLTGSKTITIAGTVMQCIEIYTGEAYTFPFQFTDSAGNAINCTLPSAWTLGTSVKYYVADSIAYNVNNIATDINVGNLTLTGNTYTGGNLSAVFTTAASGLGYLYIPADLTGAVGGGPTIPLANTSANTNIAVVTLTVTRTDTLSTPKQNISREPIGMIVRYQ
jgi:hypothetical protein